MDKKTTIIHIHGWTKALSSSVFDIAFKMKFKVVLTLHDYFTACPNGGYFNYQTNEICHLNPMSWKCIKCNCDSRNYSFKIYRVIRQFVQNKIVKLNKKLQYAISISNLSEDILKSMFKKNIKIKRINNPIDIIENTRTEISNNDYYLFVGRISKEKGIELFCEAIKYLKLKGIAIGDGKMLDQIRSKYSEINFLGWQNSYSVKKYMEGAKALIFPSQWYEGAPLTTIEAMSIGLPCIVSTKCSAKELIKDNVNGLLFDGTQKDLENTILKYESKIDLQEMSKCAYKEFCNTENQNEQYVKNLIDYYREIQKR